MERLSAPELLPILRSQQQAELLVDILDNPDREETLAELSERLGIPKSSVHREIERAEQVGIVRSRKVGKARLIRADVTSPYYEPLRQLLVAAFGVPALLGDALRGIDGVAEAYIYGSWAARWHGEPGTRPVGDIDVLVIGEPERTSLYRAALQVSQRVGREVQTQIREPGWLEKGTGTFHDTVTSRPMVKLLPTNPQARNAETSVTARSAS